MNTTLAERPKARSQDERMAVAGQRRLRRSTVERAAVMTMTLAFVAQPALHPSGPGNSSPIDLLVVVAVIATAIWAASDRVKVHAPYVVGAALMILGGAASGLVIPLPTTSLLALIQDLLLISWCTAVMTVARGPHRLTLLASAWAYAAMFSAAVLTVGSLTHISAITGVIARDGNREMFTFGDPNYAATYWVLSIFVAYAAKAPGPRPLRWVGYGLLAWALVLSESNGGMLQLLVGCMVIALAALYRRNGLPASVALLMFVCGGGAVLLHEVPLQTVRTWALNSGQSWLVNSVGRSDGSSSQRSQLIKESMQLYASVGLLGSGPSTTKQLLHDRAYPYAKEAHDDYLAALVERGPVGLLGLLILVMSAAWRAGQVMRAPPPSAAPGALPRPAGLVAALLAAGVAGTYEEVLHFRFVWALLAMVAVLAMQSQEGRRPGGATRTDSYQPKSVAGRGRAR